MKSCVIAKDYKLDINDNKMIVDPNSYFSKKIHADGDLGIIIIKDMPDMERNIFTLTQNAKEFIIEKAISTTLNNLYGNTISIEDIKNDFLINASEIIQERQIKLHKPTNEIIKDIIKEVTTSEVGQYSEITRAFAFLANTDIKTGLEIINDNAQSTEDSLKSLIAIQDFSHSQAILLKEKATREYKWIELINRKLNDEFSADLTKNKIINIESLTIN
jgi:Flp pilus assembly secretin CpaC